jgi:cellobiose phosphorylase
MPHLAQGWDSFRIHYRYRSAEYVITVRAADRDALVVDGKPQQGRIIELADDGTRHVVELSVARRQDAAVAAQPEEFQHKTIS